MSEQVDSEAARLTTDILVIGGGIGGMTAAVTAAESGLTVMVIERAPDVGGSALLSEGAVWTAPDETVFRDQDPHGNIEKYQAVIEELPAVYEWLENTGTYVGPKISDVLGYGVGRIVDVKHHIQYCRSRVETLGGWIFTNCEIRTLTLDGDVLVAEARQEGSEEAARIESRAVVIATGGFQADPEARAAWLHPRARDLFVRSNPNSCGGGIRLGLSVGGRLTPQTDGFYGHLLPYPLERVNPEDFFALAQFYSEHGVLLDQQGVRFTDESQRDHVSTEVLAARGGRALLVFDERIRSRHAMPGVLPGATPIDKPAVARRHGGRFASSASIPELAGAIAPWGYDSSRVVDSIEQFNRAMSSGTDLPIGRSRLRSPLVEPPFHAMEVQPAITFTYRGLDADLDGRVLNSTGAPIHGLYAAGVDVGGFNDWGYAGGLVRGLVFGRRVGRALTAELSASKRG